VVTWVQDDPRRVVPVSDVAGRVVADERCRRRLRRSRLIHRTVRALAAGLEGFDLEAAPITTANTRPVKAATTPPTSNTFLTERAAPPLSAHDYRKHHKHRTEVANVASDPRV
jgi:hypothetical protein